MKKILLCLCLLFGFGYAKDKNGFFLGFELGLSEVNVAGSDGINNAKVKISAPMYGFRAGYKHFFTDWVGLQGYLSFKDSFVDASSDVFSATGATEKASLHFMPIMINADVLFDFYKNQNFSLDALLGVGLGLAMVNDNKLIGNINSSHSAFYSDIKLGIGANYDNSRIGLNVAFPLSPATKNVEGIEYKLKQNYAIALAYDYRF